MYHLVLRHRKAPQLSQTEWLDENRPSWTTTTTAVGMLFDECAKKNEPLRVHRTEWMNEGAAVCCECEVAAVRPIDEHQVHVEFKNWRVLELRPLVRPARGQAVYRD